MPKPASLRASALRRWSPLPRAPAPGAHRAPWRSSRLPRWCGASGARCGRRPASAVLKHIRTQKLGMTNSPFGDRAQKPIGAETYNRRVTETATQIELDGQYRALREEAGALTRERAALLVKGSDAAEYLQGQLTNDIEALEPESGCYAALLDRKGHLTADMRVLRLEDGEIWLDLDPAPAPAVLKHLRTYSIGREVEIDDVGERWAIRSLIGPRAGELSGFEGLGPEHAQRFRVWEGIDVLAV